MKTNEFDFSQSLQDSLLVLGIYDEEVLRYLFVLVKEENFQSEYTRFVYGRLLQFYKEFSVCPEDHFWDLIEEAVSNGSIPEKKVELYAKYFHKIAELHPNKDFVLKNLDRFLHHQSLASGLVKGAKALDAGNYELAEKEMLESFRSGIKTIDLGLDYFKDASFVELPELACKSFIDPLDELLEGFRKKELWVWLASTNVGKSWAMIHTGKVGAVQGKNILHYTLADLPVEWLKIRYDMTFNAMGTREKEITLNKESYKVRSLFNNQKKILKKRSYVGKRGKIILKGAPLGGLSISGLVADLEIMELTSGFVPDIVLIDYADHMIPDRRYNEKRHELGDIYLGLANLSKERNVHIQTASQSNRNSIDAKVVSLKHFAEDIQKANHADTVVSICQTPEEASVGTMRLFNCKGRNENKGWQISMKYSYDIGQFCIDSKLYDPDDTDF